MYLKHLLLIVLFTFVVSRPDDNKSSGDGYVVRPITKRNYKRVFQENDFVFVKFFTSWCRTCGLLFDIWENVGDHYAYNKKILIADIDCETSSSLCEKFKVHKYPILMMIKNGQKLEIYDGSRLEEDLIEYIDNFLSEVHKDDVKDEA